jgi:uncharacterized membrane protein
MFDWHRKFLSKDDEPQIAQAIEEFEQSTGAEMVIAVSKSSDPYPAASLRFAIVAGLIISMIVSFFFEFKYDFLWILAYFVVMLLMIPIGMIPSVKKRLLVDNETDREVNEKAVELFHQLCTTKTEHKVSTFMYFSLMERKIRLMVDADLKDKFSQEDLDLIVEKMSNHFKLKDFKGGLLESISTIKERFKQEFPEKLSQVAPDQIHNEIFWVEAH